MSVAGSSCDGYHDGSYDGSYDGLAGPQEWLAGADEVIPGTPEDPVQPSSADDDVLSAGSVDPFVPIRPHDRGRHSPAGRDRGRRRRRGGQRQGSAEQQQRGTRSHAAPVRRAFHHVSRLQTAV